MTCQALSALLCTVPLLGWMKLRVQRRPLFINHWRVTREQKKRSNCAVNLHSVLVTLEVVSIYCRLCQSGILHFRSSFASPVAATRSFLSFAACKYLFICRLCFSLTEKRLFLFSVNRLSSARGHTLRALDYKQLYMDGLYTVQFKTRRTIG